MSGRGVSFTPSELAALDAVITQLQEQGVDPAKNIPTFTPVAAVIAEAVLSTAAVLCVKVPADGEKVSQLKALAESLESNTTLTNLIELRKRAVTASGTAAKATR